MSHEQTQPSIPLALRRQILHPIIQERRSIAVFFVAKHGSRPNLNRFATMTSKAAALFQIQIQFPRANPPLLNRLDHGEVPCSPAEQEVHSNWSCHRSELTPSIDEVIRQFLA